MNVSGKETRRLAGEKRPLARSCYCHPLYRHQFSGPSKVCGSDAGVGTVSQGDFWGNGEGGRAAGGGCDWWESQRNGAVRGGARQQCEGRRPPTRCDCACLCDLHGCSRGSYISSSLLHLIRTSTSVPISVPVLGRALRRDSWFSLFQVPRRKPE